MKKFTVILVALASFAIGYTMRPKTKEVPSPWFGAIQIIRIDGSEEPIRLTPYLVETDGKTLHAERPEGDRYRVYVHDTGTNVYAVRE